jgi:hypothetical protein
MEIAFDAGEAVRAALARIGRTEDVRFSPDERRLALAGLEANRLLVLDVETGPIVSLTGFIEIESDALRSPHGVAWLDPHVLAVANRGGAVTLFELPAHRPRSERARLEPLRTIGADARGLVGTPGSVSAIPIGLDLVELLVCNNFVHHVSRHLLDRRNGYAMLAADLLLDGELEVPDGVAHGPGGRWIAVSNHDRHNVLLYRNDVPPGQAGSPAGTLRGVAFPHGLRFAANGTALLVADAGAPFVRLFRSADGDWSGERFPSASIRVLTDEAFARGNSNPQEGGPKGIDVTRDARLMVATCERQPLAFFDLAAMLDQAGATAVPEADEAGDEAERARTALLRYFVAAEARVAGATEAIRRSSEREIRLMANSRSWRLTAPLRRLKDAVNRVRPRRWRQRRR